ncbi:MAG: biphenyl 2,3-dioxygenase [Armatimonadetes bacterium]|nr:biphenyl 2,3-dioxygenase [Armatimonadota bacterium]
MKKAIVMLAAVLLSASMVWAAGDLSRQKSVDLRVLLGAKDAEMVIRPKTWNLETGKLYKVTLVNEGKVKHEWVAPEFTLTIWTRKVEVGGAEIKGIINEIELQPGAKADWYFVPIRTGTFDMACEIEGHKEAGMVGKVVVK